MNKNRILFAGAMLGSLLLPTFTLAADKPDRIGGSARADFAADELTVPCVLVEGLDAETEGLYFDIVLKRRGKSFNYELAAAAAEDTAMCEAIAAFAELEDEDFEGDGDAGDAGDPVDDAGEGDTTAP